MEKHHEISNSLSHNDLIILNNYLQEFCKTFNLLDNSNKSLLEDYYNKNFDFYNSVINKKTYIDTNICLESVKASLNYLKVFLPDNKQ